MLFHLVNPILIFECIFLLLANIIFYTSNNMTHLIKQYYCIKYITACYHLLIKFLFFITNIWLVKLFLGLFIFLIILVNPLL